MSGEAEMNKESSRRLRPLGVPLKQARLKRLAYCFLLDRNSLGRMAPSFAAAIRFKLR